MKRNKSKIITIVLILSIIIQIISCLDLPISEISYAALIKESSVSTSLGQVIAKTTANSFKAGDTVPIEIYTTGEYIKSFIFYIDCDNEIFSEIDLNNDIKVKDKWIITDGGVTEEGYRQIILNTYASSAACTNELLATINLRLEKEIKTTSEISLKDIYLANKKYEETIYDNCDYDLTLLVGEDIQSYNIQYEANTQDTVTNLPESGIKDEGIIYTISSTIPERAGYIFAGWNTKSDGTGSSYTVGSKYELDEDLILYAQWIKEEELYLISYKYKIGDSDINVYKNGDEYISRVNAETTKQEFINNLETNGTIKILKADGTELLENELIGTGMTLQVTKGTNTIELKIAVAGDISGDGKVTISDLSSLNQVLLGLGTLENEYKLAADIDENNNLTITDLSTVNKMLLGIL